MTPPGKSTQAHEHTPSHLSCAYYVSATDGCGNLQFLDDRKHRFGEPESKSPDAVTSKRSPCRPRRE
jgi:hypothetical protein